MRTAIIFTCLVILLAACSNEADNCCSVAVTPLIECDFFINSQSGDDNNTGISDKESWQSITKVSQYSQKPGFNPGDRVCFKRGHRFYTFFNGSFESSGLPEKPIVISNYGDSSLPLPLLSTARRIEQENTWKKLPDGRYLYEGYQGCAVSQLWQDGKPLKKASSISLSDGQWYFPAYQANCSGTDGIYYKLANASDTPDLHQLHMANGTVIFSFQDGQYITIDGLAFEYTHNAIRAQSRTRPVKYIKIINNEFNNLEKGIFFESYTVDGIPYENNNITISNNTFKDIRFGMLLNGSAINNGIIKAHTDTRHRNIIVENNYLQDMVAGYSINDSSPDIEGLSFQNLFDARISNNTIINGIKKSQGIVSQSGKNVFSTGIIVWVDGNQTIENTVIENNFVTNQDHGIVLAAFSGVRVSNNDIRNNIILNSDVGIRLNAASRETTWVVHNTLVQNGYSILLNTAEAGYYIVNNLSESARINHIKINRSTGLSSFFDNNLYAPDTNVFFYTPTNQSFNLLSEWQLNNPTWNINSIVSASSDLQTANPVIVDDFNLKETSVAIDKAASLVSVTKDFLGNNRISGSAADIGALEFQLP